MRFLRSWLWLAAPAAFIACDSSSTLESIVAPNFVESTATPSFLVSGGGTVVTGSGQSAYSFRASMDGAAQVRGQVEIHFSSVPWRIHGAVTCLSIDGNDAWLGAVITRSNATAPAWQVGQSFVWRARDNGEGAATVDQVRGFAARPAAACNNRPLFALIEWTNGDVQIKDLGVPVPVPVLEAGELCSDYASFAIATFEDANLEAAVRASLGVPADPLTCGQLATVEALFAEFSSISSLAGIQNLTALRYAELDNNAIIDISPLSGLTGLGHLRLEGNAITDIGALAGLTNLDNWLDLSANAITDISALGSLTKLQALHLNENSVTDISALSGLTSLNEVSLEGNPHLSIIQPLIDNAGLEAGDQVNLFNVDPALSCADVAILEARGVNVLYSACTP